MCVCVCVLPRRLLITGVMWCDIDPKRLVEKVLWLYMAAAVRIVNGCGISIHTHLGN